tara:strand:- start:384 stop:845 length:462 start_codon:yes stop_codon:yes gene_type:complete
MLKLIKAVERDAINLAPRLRAIDVLEVKAVGSTPKKSLLKSFSLPNTKVFSGIDLKTNEVVLMYGVCDSIDDPNTGVIWMLASPSIHKHKKDVYKLSKPTIDDLSKPYKTVYNFVHKDNKTSIRWLEWAGFTVDKSKVFDQGGEDFYLLFKES